ncbi:serine hydrolase domain-containing protein [Nocardioides gansuensis]|uniref:serine hydrolase domain-containing protein n=1 Tax=Nocardioides gansuensis TaxID=2138300 RepID=UPI001404102D|nr:serine hydrolase domain-containing protein [Nocardioides gansuensis]
MSRLDDLDALIGRTAPHHSALAVATTGPGGGGIHRAGRHEVPPGALWQIGSVTKVFTALVLARAVVRGDVTLETPVAALLPGLEARAPITLGQLATHTAGLPRVPGSVWRHALTRDADPYAGIDAGRLRAAVGSARLRGAGRPRYSNLGFGLLGHALAAAAGTAYGDLVHAEVCEPLGLADTTTTPPASRTLTGHTRRGRARARAWGFDAMAGCGALWSSIEDMQRFAAHVVDPPEGELGEAMRLAATPVVETAGVGHGLGWLVLRRGPAAGCLFHNGGTYGFRSALVADPATGRAAVALAATDRSVDGLAFRALKAAAA